MSASAIQWTDITDNIIRVFGGGWWCEKISPGCKNCYAELINGNPWFGGNKLKYGGKVPTLMLMTDIIDGWKRETKPKRHFVSSMTDVFGKWVPRKWQFYFLDGMRAAPLQTFQVLTKRADIMQKAICAWLKERGLEVLPANIWPGVSVENQHWADKRIPWLRRIPAATRFLSVEPMLGPVDVSADLGWTGKNSGLQPPLSTALEALKDIPTAIHWVIYGGESGKRARPCNVEWIRGGVKQCQAAGVAAFVKQLGSRPCFTSGDSMVSMRTNRHRNCDHVIKDPKGGDMAEWPEDLRVREFPQVS